MVHTLNLKLWEAIRDGNLQRAEAALEEGADPNLSLSVTFDASTGQRQWDLFAGAHLTWRHVNVISFEGSPYKPSITGGVPASRAAIATEGDTLLHLAVKLRWSALLAVLAARIEVDELRTNADGLCAEAVAWELGSGRVELYRDAFVGPHRQGRPQPPPLPHALPPGEHRLDSIALMGGNFTSGKGLTREGGKGDVWQRLGVEGPSPDLWPHLAKAAHGGNTLYGESLSYDRKDDGVGGGDDAAEAAALAAEAAAWERAELNANKTTEESAAGGDLLPVEQSVASGASTTTPPVSAPLLLPPPRESPRSPERAPLTASLHVDSLDVAAPPSSPLHSAGNASNALPKEPLTPTELLPLSPLRGTESPAAWNKFDERTEAVAPSDGETGAIVPSSPLDALAIHVSRATSAPTVDESVVATSATACTEGAGHAKQQKTPAGITRFAPWHEPPTLGSPLRVARAEFRKGARRLLEADYRRKADEGREVNIAPPKLASHVEQPMYQPDPCPRPHDETTPPVFPRGMRLPIESADRSWRAPSLNGFNVQFATPSLPTVDMILSQSHGEVFARFQDQLLSKPRFLLLRPSPSLVTVVGVEEARHGAHTATPLQQHASSGTHLHSSCYALPSFSSTAAAGATTTAAEGEAGSAYSHLVVVYRVDGDKSGRKHRRPAEWFRTNSRPAHG